MESFYRCGICNASATRSIITSHKSLHGATSTFVAKVNSTEITEQHMHQNSTDPDSVLFAIQSNPSSGGDLNTLFDDAANCCLIRKDAAISLNLVGEPIKMGIRTPIGSKTVTSHTYKVPLTDNSNVQHVITAFEVENISEDMMEVDVSGVKHIFSSTVQGMWESVCIVYTARRSYLRL